MVEKYKKLLDRAIIESHCVHPLIGIDIGEIKHMRIQSVLREFPDADYMSVSEAMEELDKEDTKVCQTACKKWAESVAHAER